MWLVHAFRDVIRNELANCAPQPGDKITISLRRQEREGLLPLPRPPRRRSPHQVNWVAVQRRHAAGRAGCADRGRRSPEAAAPPSPSEQAARFGDDIPWE